MGCMAPFAQITGTARIYLAPYGTNPPDIDSSPDDFPEGWVYLGETDGEQSIAHTGPLTYFRTNERTGPVKAVRPEEDVTVTVTLVELSLENYARVLHSADNVVTDEITDPETKRMPFKRGDCPTEYALLMHGAADSPYGLFPAYNYLPRVVSASEPTVTRAKDGRAALEAIFQALEDPEQDDEDALGWALVQTEAVVEEPVIPE
jgi:hypothetical protein